MDFSIYGFCCRPVLTAIIPLVPYTVSNGSPLPLCGCNSVWAGSCFYLHDETFVHTCIQKTYKASVADHRGGGAFWGSETPSPPQLWKNFVGLPFSKHFIPPPPPPPPERNSYVDLSLGLQATCLVEITQKRGYCTYTHWRLQKIFATEKKIENLREGYCVEYVKRFNVN